MPMDRPTQGDYINSLNRYIPPHVTSSLASDAAAAQVTTPILGLKYLFYLKIYLFKLSVHVRR